MPNANGDITVAEYQEMEATGKWRSGTVDLLSPLDGPITEGKYLTRCGGVVRIMGVAHNLGGDKGGDGSLMWAGSGDWYHTETGKVRWQSQFYGLHKRVEGQ